MRIVVFEIGEEDLYSQIESDLPVPEVPPPFEPLDASLEPVPEVKRVPDPAVTTYDHLVELAAQPKNVELKVSKAFPVALFHYKGANSPCVMCLQPLMRICHRCQSRESSYNECSILVGECGHLIHKHCLYKFENTELCLTCRQPWRVAKEVLLA